MEPSIFVNKQSIKELNKLCVANQYFVVESIHL